MKTHVSLSDSAYIMNFYVTLILILAKCSLLFAALTNHWETRQVKTYVSEARIVGGHEAKPHSHPYLVSLQLRFLWVRMHICGGTLLNKNWVLTAGHCIRESWIVRWLPLDVVAGAHDVDKLGPESQVVTVSQRIHHPLYNGGIGPNDIAVLKTSTPFEFTKEVFPPYLPEYSKLNPDSMILTGWGVVRTTAFFPDLPGKLQEVNVTYVPYDECYTAVEELKEENESNPLDKDANICTGPLTGGVAGCNGDSGGPLIQYISKQKYYDNDPVEETTSKDSNDYGDYNGNEGNESNDEEKIPVVLGIVSWGVSPCGQKGAPTVYTRVSHYVDFIKQHIKT